MEASLERLAGNFDLYLINFIINIIQDSISPARKSSNNIMQSSGSKQDTSEKKPSELEEKHIETRRLISSKRMAGTNWIVNKYIDDDTQYSTVEITFAKEIN